MTLVKQHFWSAKSRCRANNNKGSYYYVLFWIIATIKNRNHSNDETLNKFHPNYIVYLIHPEEEIAETLYVQGNKNIDVRIQMEINLQMKIPAKPTLILNCYSV